MMSCSARIVVSIAVGFTLWVPLVAAEEQLHQLVGLRYEYSTGSRHRAVRCHLRIRRRRPHLVPGRATAAAVTAARGNAPGIG